MRNKFGPGAIVVKPFLSCRRSQGASVEAENANLARIRKHIGLGAILVKPFLSLRRSQGASAKAEKANLARIRKAFGHGAIGRIKHRACPRHRRAPRVVCAGGTLTNGRGKT